MTTLNVLALTALIFAALVAPHAISAGKTLLQHCWIRELLLKFRAQRLSSQASLSTSPRRVSSTLRPR